MFYPESEVSKVEPLGKQVKFMRSDLQSLSLGDYNNAIYGSRNEKKENTIISFKPNFTFQEIERATLVNTDDLKGCVFQYNGRRMFAPMAAISEITDSVQFVNYSEQEKLEMRRKEEEKHALSKYFEIKKYFDKHNISVSDFPKLDSFTESVQK